MNLITVRDPIGEDVSPFGLIVRFSLLAGHEQAFDDLVSTALTGIRRYEPGTLIYASHCVRGEPTTRIFYELYQDEEAFRVHEAQPHVQRFFQEQAQHVADVSVQFLDRLTDSKGVYAVTTGHQHP